MAKNQNCLVGQEALEIFSEALRHVCSPSPIILQHDGIPAHPTIGSTICTQHYLSHTTLSHHCSNCCQRLIKRCGTDGAYVSHTCEHGFTYTIFPVQTSAPVLFYILYGPYLERPPDKNVFLQNIKSYDFPENNYLDDLASVPVINNEIFKSLTAQLSTYAALLSNMLARHFTQQQSLLVLEKSEREFRDLVQNANSIIFRRDLSGNIQYMNDFALTFFGYPRDEIIGKNVIGTIVPKIDTNGYDLIKMINDINNNPDQYATNENENMLKNGTRVWISWTNKAVTNEQGMITEIICIGNDLTQHKQDERILIENEERFRAISESTPDAVITIDESGVILFWNKSGTRIFGYSADEAIGSQIQMLLPENKRGIDRQLMQKFISQGNSVVMGKTIEMILRKKNSVNFSAEVSYSHWEMNGLPFISVIIRDVSERKQIEEELLKARKLESIGSLAGGLAHDYNNILSVIIGNISLAQTYLNPTHEAYALLQEAEKASLNAKRLTKKLITFSNGGIPCKREADISDILQNTTELALSGSNIEFNFNFSHQLRRVALDEGQINQTIHGIITNAREAMQSGGTLSVSAHNFDMAFKNPFSLPAGPYVQICIQDTGAGIENKNLEKIFDPFYSTKSRGTQKGMGLGLSICHSIVKHHGGYIQINSIKNQGATVTILLPGTDSTTYQNPRAPIHAKPSAGNILIMDDEQMILDLSKQMLLRLGYAVELAGDGTEAIEKYQRALAGGTPFDLVIVDLTVRGGMGGVETMQRLREITPNVIVLLSSGYADAAEIKNFKHYGFAGIVPKPYRLPDLKTILLRTLLKSPCLQDRNTQDTALSSGVKIQAQRTRL